MSFFPVISEEIVTGEDGRQYRVVDHGMVPYGKKGRLMHYKERHLIHTPEEESRISKHYTDIMYRHAMRIANDDKDK